MERSIEEDGNIVIKKQKQPICSITGKTTFEMAKEFDVNNMCNVLIGYKKCPLLKY